ncbi:MAG TPA: hypothetical protein VD902_17215, partial [Symbiobacteriaceae bacterium]|nr:hypothetical protein [Symbiobacteriaceae bacterium]
MLKVKPRPGIVFQTVPPPLRDKLPRMDVAAFVGFASAGPLHRPVVVEDEVHFRQIFGDDPELAWDSRLGAPHRAYLGTAVRAFFRNGGRRCWVVRVAGDSAVPNRFLVPGLVRVDGDGRVCSAELLARSEGPWSDALRVGAALTSLRLGLVNFALPDTGAVVTVSARARDRVAPGDLLRLTFQQAVLFLAVSQVERTGSAWVVKGRESWFQLEAALPADGAGVAVAYRGPDGVDAALDGALWHPPAQAGGEHRVLMPGSSGPGIGALLVIGTRLLMVTGSRLEGKQLVLTGRDSLTPLADGRPFVGAMEEPVTER